MKKILLLLLLLQQLISLAQETDSLKLVYQQLDSLYIHEEESKGRKPKVLHAEPLYVDLIRDLGAHRGEKEWNIGFGIRDNVQFDTYQALIEYEFAPVDRFGLEIELPISIVAPLNGAESDSVPPSRLESLKLATQWTFLVSDEHNLSLALGYIHEFEFSSFRNFGNPLFTGNIFNPFFIAAKRFGNNYHALIYTGPKFEQDFKTNQWRSHHEINTSFHYMITGTRNFIGVEFNKQLYKSVFDMVIRPQIRLGIADNFLMGIVTGVPVNRENQRFSFFMRIIWEPGHKIQKH
ncbi:MAG: phosphoribosylformylglycinamidine synthase [Flammeovirgaceae bacterium]|nr:MAG: phosphoribosylformylglycinamidine synthase [Flammeovirgaceae bacterium]